MCIKYNFALQLFTMSQWYNDLVTVEPFRGSLKQIPRVQKDLQ